MLSYVCVCRRGASWFVYNYSVSNLYVKMSEKYFLHNDFFNIYCYFAKIEDYIICKFPMYHSFILNKITDTGGP